MDSRERVRRALTCRSVDRTPKALSFFATDVPGIGPATPEEYFGLDLAYVEFEPPPEQSRFLRYLEGLPRDVHVGSQAQLRTYHEWNYHPELPGGSPLSGAHSIADIRRFAWPALQEADRHSGVTAGVMALHDRGLAAAGAPPHLGGELFESAWRLRGFENFLVDLVRHQELADYLLDQLTALALHSTLILARAGVDILLLDDDIAMPTGLLISRALWQRFFKPRLTDLIQAARAENPDILIFYHSDGDFTAIVPDLVDIGVNVINPVQPDCMDAVAIKRAFGDRLALWGTAGTAWLWNHGRPDQIRREVFERIHTLGPTGLLLSPAYDVDYVPLGNLVAFAEAVQDGAPVSRR